MRERVIKYYENLLQYYGTYHNHKEISAWAGLAFYVIFAGFVNLLIIPEKQKLLTVIITTGFVFIVLILVCIYIKLQIKMKNLASSFTSTACFFLSKIVTEELNETDLKKYLDVVESDDKKTQSSHFLPKLFLENAKIMGSKGRRYQDNIKFLIFTILICVTLLLMYIKWSIVLS